MKTSTVACVLMLVAAVALIAAPAFAMPISMKDSADFSCKAFEGDASCVDGTNTVWTMTASSADTSPSYTFSSDGDIVTYSTGDRDKCYWDGSASAEWQSVNNMLGYTLEYRLKINSQYSAGWQTGKGPFTASLAGNTTRPELFVSSFGTMQRQRASESVSLSENLMDTSDNTDEFHIFRVAREGDYMDGTTLVRGKAYYWRDGVLISDPAGVIGLEHLDALYTLNFGDASDGRDTGRGSASIDYVRFDTTGAYAPIPEPSTIALLAAGLIGLLAYAWRKRR